ncbi:MAG: transcription termination/antitermination NusG family protein [Chloroflexota bacterium]
MSTHWYALRTKPHKEQFVTQQLQAREVVVYFPSLRVKPKNPRAARIRPYFPGYLFVQADLAAVGQNAFSWLPGVQGLVAFGGMAAAVPERLILELQQQLAQTTAAELAQRRFQPGDRVRIVSGPFAGYEAIFDMHLPGKERVQVLLSFLSHYPQPVQMDGDDLVRL